MRRFRDEQRLFPAFGPEPRASPILHSESVARLTSGLGLKAPGVSGFGFGKVAQRMRSCRRR